MNFSFKFDTSNLVPTFKKGLSVDNINNAFIQLGSMIVNDAVTKPPTPRIDTGNLRGSWSIALAGRLFKNGDSPGQIKPDVEGMKRFELRIGFNMPYALDMHEGIRKDGTEVGYGAKSILAKPNTGNYFLSTKINNKQKIYLKFLQDKLV